MGKMMAYALMTCFVVEAGMKYFSGDTWTQTYLFGLLSDPSGIISSVVYTILIVLLAASAAAAITPGFIYQTNQYALFAGAVISLITYVAVYGHFFSFILGQLSGFAGPTAATLTAFLICAPLIVVFLTAMIEWTRFNQ